MSFSTSIGFCSSVDLEEEDALGLIGWSDIPRGEVMGVLAHEVAHGMLKHHEQRLAFALKKRGIHVESLEDVSELYAATGICTSKKLPEKQSAKSLLENVMKLEGPFWTSKLFFMERYPPPRSKDQEKEADLLTLKVPLYARVLRDYFFNDQFRKNLGSKNDSGGNTHPPHSERVAYLTQALCQQYPKKNQDICPGTCPLIIEEIAE